MPHRPWIHWHKGMFLTPHLFQEVQRVQAESRHEDRVWALPYAHGLVEASLNAADLAQGKVSFRKLHAIMEGGEVVDWEFRQDQDPQGGGSARGNMHVTPCDIKPIVSGKTNWDPIRIHLAIPKLAATRAIAAKGREDDGSARYRVEPMWLPEMSDGESNKERDVQGLRLQALLLPRDRVPGSTFDSIPVVQVRPGTGGKLIDVDRNYVPPCVLASAWQLPGGNSPAGSTPVLDLCASLANTLRERRDQQHAVLYRRGDAPSASEWKVLRMLLALQAVGRGASRIDTLVHRPHVSPWELYGALLELANELLATHAGEGRHLNSSYRHEDAWPQFVALEQKIDQLTRLIGGREVATLAFRRENDWWKAELSKAFAGAKTTWYLGVRSSTVPADSIRRYVLGEGNWNRAQPIASQTFKVMWAVENPVERNQTGVVLRPVDRVGGIDDGSGEWTYFEVHWATTDDDVKKRILDGGAVWIEWADRRTPFEFEPILKTNMPESTED